ncbi:hypothetical protein [Paenibacillus sp. y28]|uniref:hypothetical protein n=1 Tax=Paenibacillus sp. y28 TaxID=3129110 RepID=UPI0030171B54
MAQLNLSNPEVYQLEKEEAWLVYADLLITNVKQSEVQRLISELASDSEEEQQIRQDIQMKFFAEAFRLSSIAGVYTHPRDDEKLQLVFRQENGQTVQKECTFASKEEKERFIKNWYSTREKEYTYEQRTNTVWNSIRQPLVTLLQTIIFGGGLSWLAYYITTAEEYSFRVPAVFYFVIRLMEYIGYVPFMAVTGLIVIVVLIWLVRRALRPTQRLIIEKRQAGV